MFWLSLAARISRFQKCDERANGFRTEAAEYFPIVADE
jgi:hypothetical protein